MARRYASCRPTDGDIERLHLRTGSYANWPVLAHAAAREPAARLPADQQELRALLRLRGPLSDVRPSETPAARTPPDRPVRLRAAAARSRCATSMPARATAASTSSPRPPTPTTTYNATGSNIVASPRHADVLLVTGQITTRMAGPLRRAYEAMPEPRLVAALGDCASGCGLLGDAQQLAGALEEILPVDLRIRGCPPNPQQIADALLTLVRGGDR